MLCCCYLPGGTRYRSLPCCVAVTCQAVPGIGLYHVVLLLLTRRYQVYMSTMLCCCYLPGGTRYRSLPCCVAVTYQAVPGIGLYHVVLLLLARRYQV